ncbi:deoxyguanosinetriphosphate triphosphohydrolase [bacterium]|nr:deoxyguanosinetriphosphate triphosphohydrolase [bacterium]
MPDTPAFRSLAPYATLASQTKGRQHQEAEHATRSAFQRDRDRIIHSAAFRRLEYKTQVFVNHEGDHYRTRLTHSLEVAQLSRAISRQLGLDDDLAEALALAHDLGHTPFGHAGEDALNEAMHGFGGFDHNAQTIRILTKLEDRYASFHGINLTWETLEGIAKHNGPLQGPHVPKDRPEKPLPRALKEFNAEFDLELSSWPGMEAQVAALSDDIAYHSHDIDDGLRAGLFTVEQIAVLPIVGEAFAETMKKYPHAKREQLVHESLRRFINRMVSDVVETTRANIKASGVESAADVRALGKATVEFSAEASAANAALKKFLMKQMYRHYKVNRMTSKARRLVTELFAIFLNEPECLPPEWQHGPAGSQEQAVAACDYLAGMTDRFAMQEHRKLFGLSHIDG